MNINKWNNIQASEFVYRKDYNRLLREYETLKEKNFNMEFVNYFLNVELNNFNSQKRSNENKIISKLEKQNKKLKNSIHKAYTKHVKPKLAQELKDNLSQAFVNSGLTKEYANTVTNGLFWENQGPKLPPKEVDSNIATDNIVESVVDTFRDRSKFGVAKYGTTLQDNDSDDFLKHLQEELMDATLYIEKLRTAKSFLTKTEEPPTVSSSQLSQYLHSIYFR